MDVTFNSLLKQAITFDFVHHVKPETFLCIVHSVNSEVLTSHDLSIIKAETNQKGDIQGAYKLLDCLIVYESWFDCTIKVLEHPEMKLKAVASKLKCISDEINSKYMNKTIAHPYSASEITANSATLQWMVPNRPSNADPLSTLELQVDEADDKEDSEVELEPDSATSIPKEVCLEENNISEPRESHPGSSEEQCAVSIVKKVMTNPRKIAKHGPEYDFTDDEMISLRACKGWHPQITEIQVREILDRQLHEDGHFLMFYWERKKRPAISVTFEGMIKTFLIHKKPAYKVGPDTLYYIDRNGPCDKNLKCLINTHIQDGIVNMSNPHPQSIISLLSPISAKSFAKA